MIIHNVAQGTSAWLELRKGIPTASMFDNIITPGGKPSESAPKYLAHLLAERVLGRPIDGFKSKWMELGNEYEDRAIASYELSHGCDTERIGFVTTDDGTIGCSPDRFIVGQADGMVEAKAPSPAVHVSYLLAAAGASKEYKVQLQGELWACEKDWVDIVSYCPEMPEVTFRAYRDEEFIDKMARAVRTFAEHLGSQAADFAARGWIKERVAEIQDERGFITQEDLDWAKGLSNVAT